MSFPHRVVLGALFTIFIASLVMSASAALRHPSWYKGNLHAHSNRTEGDAPPAEVARWYKEHGYQFFALSDNNVMPDRAIWSEEVPGEFLILNAAELSVQSGVHVNAIGAVQPVAGRESLSRRRALFDNVEAVRHAGGIASVNHPQLAELTFNDVMHLDGGFLLEINDGRVNPQPKVAAVPPAERLWDELLTAGRTVYAIASDDAHYFRDAAGRTVDVPGTGWIAVRASSFDRDAILAGIEKGELYASTGVVLRDIRWNGGELRVSIGGVMGARYRTTFIGADSRVLWETFANPAVYRPSAEDGYVRARVDDHARRSAWTQAVRVASGAAARTGDPLSTGLSRRIAAALDAVPLDGPIENVPPYSAGGSECDQPPENSAEAGERRLAERRAVRGGAFEDAKAVWVSTQHPSAKLEAYARAVRERYQATMAPRVPARMVTGIEVRPLTLTYPARYEGHASSARVRAKVIDLLTLDDRGRKGRLTTYYLNYDQQIEDGREVVLVSSPHASAHLLLGFVTEGAFAGLAGKIAVAGTPLLLYDATGMGASSRAEEWEQRLSLEAADLQLIDAALLRHFARVDVVGSTESIAHLLVSHRSAIRSAYLVHFIPLWTRNDVAPRTGGPFGTDEDTDHVVFQTQFQWADFLAAAAHDRVRLGLALNAGSSGLGKAGLLHEIVPVLRRLSAAFEIRGDDPDADGFGRGRAPVCAGFDVTDVRDFWEHRR